MRIFFSLAIILVSNSCFSQTRTELDSLTSLLERVSVDDQKLRLGWDSIMQKYGINSPQFIELVQKMNKQDSINMSIVGNVIDRFGWLSAEQTSKDANAALFLVIQHATLPSQLKYLPEMKKAVAENKAKASDYALLVDRTNMFQGKFQVYGSQFNYDTKGRIHIFPIADEPHLNDRRKAVGLPSMEEYCKMVSQYTNQSLVYILPETDRYKNKVVIKGSVTSKKSNEEISDVSVSIGNNRLIGRTDSTGFFQIVVDKKLVTGKVIFRKKGYQTTHLRLEGQGKEVYEVNAVLLKK